MCIKTNLKYCIIPILIALNFSVVSAANIESNIEGDSLTKEVTEVAVTKEFIGKIEQSSEIIELAYYLFTDFNQIPAIFPNLSEGWNMGVDLLYDKDISLGSALDVHHTSVVNSIVLRKHAKRYSLLGITSDLDKETAAKALIKVGFAPGTKQDVYVLELEVEDHPVTVRLFYDISYMDDQTMPYIHLTAAWIDHPEGCMELSSWLGSPIEEVKEEFKELSMNKTEDSILLENDEVQFLASLKEGSPEPAIISNIKIKKKHLQSYCLYGLVPGVSWEEMGPSCGLQGGGSGELVDPEGNTLDMYHSQDPENPSICLRKVC